MFHQEPVRIQPNMPVGDYVTYNLASPLDTTVQAACHQVGCQAYAHGWQTVIDESTPMGKNQGDYIRHQSKRDFKESRTGEGLTVFTFSAFQRCFADHKTRPEVYAVRGGDWRGNPTGMVRRHVNAADWVEDFSEHQDEIKTLIERG